MASATAVYVGLGYNFKIWSPTNWQQIKNEVPYKSLPKNHNLPDISA